MSNLWLVNRATFAGLLALTTDYSWTRRSRSWPRCWRSGGHVTLGGDKSELLVGAAKLEENHVLDAQSW